MHYINLLLFLTLILFGACNNENKSGATENKEVDMDTITFTTSSNKLFYLIEDRSSGNSLSSVTIINDGFESVNDSYDFGDTDPIEKAFLADLDNNGFDEVYFITHGVGSGSYSKIYGLASNRDKSVSQIYVNEDQSDQIFEGYMGHNEYKIEENTLVNSFPVYKAGDPNAAPSGGERTLEYELIAGEAGWILKPFRIRQ